MFHKEIVQLTHTNEVQMTNNEHTVTTNKTILTEESNIPTSHARIQNTRRINVVKEVEKLKKNGEEQQRRKTKEKADWELFNIIMEYRRGLDIKPLPENDAIDDHLVTVCVRKRPLNKKELARNEVDVITIPSKNQLIVHELKNNLHLTKYLENQLFRFDHVFDETWSNEMVYRYTVQPLVKKLFEGGFATCFACGQTGSGKTHTMGGDFNGKNQDCHKGIYALAAADIFKLAKSSKYRHLDLVISCSFYEIYSGKVYDFLNNKAELRMLVDGKQNVHIFRLTEKVVCSADEVMKLIEKGNQLRTFRESFANSKSSKSHAVFQIYLRSSNNLDKKHGTFSLIDLVGNERRANMFSTKKQTMKDTEINDSFLALKEWIRALGSKKAYWSSKVSKLALVLGESFIGVNTRTCMIAMVSPGVSSWEYTLNTLRYAEKMKKLTLADLSDDQQRSEDVCSLNDNTLTPEILNFQHVISKLEIAEKNMLNNHKQTVEELLATYEKAGKLLRITDEVTYDQEAYCKNWEDLIDNALAYIVKSKEIVEDYQANLLAKEQLSLKSCNN